MLASDQRKVNGAVPPVGLVKAILPVACPLQRILVEVDSINPSDFDFIRDTIFNKGKLNPDGTNITDTFIARNFEFNAYSKCLYFDLYNDNILISRFSKLVNSNPKEAEMFFIYYGADMYENELKIK